MRATFADESWKKNFWFEHIVLAHINLSQELDWFYQLLFNLRQDNPDVKEFKAYKVIELMSKLDINTRKKIWKSLQDTIIVVQDPKDYMKSTGIEVLQDGSFRFRYKDSDLTIDRSHGDYKPLNEQLQKQLCKLILIDSPISKICFSLNELPGIYPRNEFFTPENILSLINKKDSKKEVMGTIKLAARLCSAFYELIDPQTQRRILEQLYQYESDFFFFLPDYHQKILKQSISSNRFFDKGHKMSIDIIKKCFEIIGNNLEYDKENTDSLYYGEVEELDSKDNIMLQASDWASGIAYSIYEQKGLKGLKEKFSCIIFNGEII